MNDGPSPVNLLGAIACFGTAMIWAALDPAATGPIVLIIWVHALYTGQPGAKP